MRFTVVGNPIAQPRPKFRSKPFPGTYTPKKHAIHAWRKKVAAAVAEEGSGYCFFPQHPMFKKGTPIIVEMQFTLRRTKSSYTTKGRLKKGTPIDHVQTPDLDNLVKPILDEMTQGGVMHDDGQVVDLRIKKRWNDALTAPGVDVYVNPTTPAMMACWDPDDPDKPWLGGPQ